MATTSVTTYRVSSPLFGNFYDGDQSTAEATASALAVRLDVTMTVYKVETTFTEVEDRIVVTEKQRMYKEFSPRRLMFAAA